MVSCEWAVMNSNFFFSFSIAKPVFNGEVTQCLLWVKGCFLGWAIGRKVYEGPRYFGGLLRKISWCWVTIVLFWLAAMKAKREKWSVIYCVNFSFWNFLCSNIYCMTSQIFALILIFIWSRGIFLLSMLFWVSELDVQVFYLNMVDKMKYPDIYQILHIYLCDIKRSMTLEYEK